jgi:hypothetical protein
MEEITRFCYIMDVGELFGQEGHRHGHDMDYILLTLTKIGQVPVFRFLPDALGHLHQRRVRNVKERLADAAGQAQAAQAQFFGGGQHGIIMTGKASASNGPDSWTNKVTEPYTIRLEK